MPSPRLTQAIFDLEQEIIRNRPKVSTKSPTPSYPNGYQEIQLRQQRSLLALQSAQVQLERVGEIG